MLDCASRLWLVAFGWQVLLAAPAAATYEIAAWGADGSGQVSGAPPGNLYLAVDAGSFFGLALTTNGTIDAWGLDGAMVGYMASGFFVTVLYYPYQWFNLAFAAALHLCALRAYRGMVRARQSGARASGALAASPVPPR